MFFFPEVICFEFRFSAKMLCMYFFIMPCNAGKIKRLVNIRPKQTLNTSAVPFELKDHLSIIAYNSLTSLVLVIKNSSVSHAKKAKSLSLSLPLWAAFVIDPGWTCPDLNMWHVFRPVAGRIRKRFVCEVAF